MVETTGLVAIAAAGAVGLCAIAAALAQKEIGSAAVGVTAEKDSFFPKALILTLLPETMVIFGLVISILIIGLATATS